MIFSIPFPASHYRMNATGMIFAVLNLVWLVGAALSGAEDEGLSSGIQVTKYAPTIASFPGCTHIAFSGKTEIVTAGDRLFYRTDSQTRFRESAVKGLNDAHSVVFNPHDRLFYATDTGNHRLITFRDPTSPQVQNSLTSLAEVKLQRPHDIVFDQSIGWLYSLNPDSSQVFRFKTAGKAADALDLSRHLGYSHALTIVNGRLYVMGSSVGAVVEVVDFGKQQYKIHNSFEKKKDAPAGSWKSTGLVLNEAVPTANGCELPLGTLRKSVQENDKSRSSRTMWTSSTTTGTPHLTSAPPTLETKTTTRTSSFGSKSGDI
ncbi:MAG: hypothetical protein ABGX07_09270 [Pirellulaceae bacterium]|nr:hypothetical protein [Planctomycetota bacterium]